jgi:hypothetical protein
MSGKIHRLKKESDFVTLDNHALRNKELSWKGKGLHSYLMHLPDDWQINIADLQNRSDDGRDSTAAGLRELIKAGYVTRTRVIDDKTKQFIGYDYNIYERPEHAIAVNGKAVNGLSVTGKAEYGKPVTNKDTVKVELKEVKIKGSKDITPQAAFITTHTPTEFENIEVVIVEGQTFDLEEKTNLEPITPAARPLQELSKEQAAKEAARSDAELRSELEAQSVDEARQVFAAIEGKKARKPKPAGNSTAAVCAEISDPQVLDFFHGIHAAWGEWIDYKRREKKGTYKTAKTEAATIAALAKGVNYDPAAGRAAIEHSIAHTYTGIYPPKDTTTTAAPAARYSLEDRPQATTPEQMKVELSRFYNANSALLSEAQKTAETNYTGDRLRSIVIDFCGNRVERKREGETFGQHHAALGSWLKRQKEFDAAKSPATTQHTAGPQPQAPLRSAAPVNYSIK